MSEDHLETQTHNALMSAMRATHALTRLYTQLQCENPDSDYIEEQIWEANEAIGFAETYVSDDIGVVQQFKDSEHFDGFNDE